MFNRFYCLSFLIVSSTIIAHENLGGKFDLGTRVLNTPPLTWAHEQAGISYDEDILRFDRLENGMRLAFGTRTDGDECTFLLLVAAGSLAEEPHEVGMAHLVEHLAFRANRFGGRNLTDVLVDSVYGNANLVVNGATTTGLTIYLLRLKQCHEKSHAVKALADIAYRTSFSQEDLEKEMRIVDSEEMQNFHGEIMGENQKSVLAFHRASNFLPRVWPHAEIQNVIGRKRVRDQFNLMAVNRFYRKWYDPRRMAFAFIGNGEDQTEVLSALKDEFADFQVDTELPPMTRHDFEHDSDYIATVIDDINLPHNHEILLEDVSTPYFTRNFDEESKRQEVVYFVVRHALEQAMWKSTSSRMGLLTDLYCVRTKEGQLSLGLKINLPNTSVESADIYKVLSSINRHFTEGFGQNEIDIAKAIVKRDFEDTKMVLTRSRDSIEQAIIGSFAHIDVKLPSAPSWLQEELDKIDAEACLAAFGRAWKDWLREGRIMMTSARHKSLDLAYLNHMLETFDRIKPVEFGGDATQSKTMPEFANFAPADEIPVMIKKAVSGRRAFFINNDLQLWSTPNGKDDEVQVFIALGDVGIVGRDVLENGELAVLSMVGCKGLCRDEMSSLFPRIHVRFFPIASGLLVMGFGPKQDLPKILSVMHAYLTEPNISEIDNSGLRNSLLPASFGFPQISAASCAEFIAELLPIKYESYEKKNDDFLKSYLDKISIEKRLQELRNSGITKLGFVGIEDLPESIALFAGTFGDFKWSYSPPLAPMAVKSGVSTAAKCLDGHCPTARVLVLFPLEERIQLTERRDYEALAFFLERAIFEEVRIKAGDGYQPKVRLMDSQGMVNDLYLIDIDVSVEQAEGIASLIKNIAAGLAAKIDNEVCWYSKEQSSQRYCAEKSCMLPFLLDNPVEEFKTEDLKNMA